MKTSHIFFSLLTLLLLIAPRQSRSHAQDVTSDMLGRINTLRQSLGAHNYTYNSTLSAAANNHAEWMVSTGQVVHTQTNGSTPRSRAANFGYPSNTVSENIYMGLNATVATAWTWWMNSSIHYRGITHSAYTEVGIGHAIGQHGQAFVLVFGNPNGWGASPGGSGNTANNSTNGDNAANSQTAFVVGTDENGNIMHEIQSGDTLGQIAIRYGYGWDDVPYIRELNNMTEADVHDMKVGEIILIPPYDSTPTPTADPDTAIPTPEEDDPPLIQAIQVTPGSTENAIVLQSDALEFQTITPTVVNDMGILVTPISTESPMPITSRTPTPIPTQSWTVVTVTPTSQPIAVADASNNNQNTNAISTVPQTEVIVEQRIPTWLIGVIAAQAVIIIGAGFEFIRRRRS